jgi:large subunit ribosomal protein L21
MYAVIKTGGKQYRVAEGDILNLEKLDGDTGTSIAFDEVLMVGTEEESTFGQPLVAGAGVTGTILEQGRDKKIVVFKFKRRKQYKRKQGHRQHFTRVRIDAIQTSSAKAAEASDGS